MSARTEILDRVRTALGERVRTEPVVRNYRTAGALAPSLQLLTERIAHYRASVHRATPGAMSELLATLLPDSVVVPAGVPDAWLTQLAEVVRDEPPLTVHELDDVSSVLTLSAVAIAETGTVVLDAGPGQGRRALTLVPDHHVVVVRARDVVANVPDALTRLNPLRPQTWISGPSATSDIELDRVEGVHGPRRLDVVLLEDDD